MEFHTIALLSSKKYKKRFLEIFVTCQTVPWFLKDSKHIEVSLQKLLYPLIKNKKLRHWKLEKSQNAFLSLKTIGKYVGNDISMYFKPMLETETQKRQNVG